MIIVISCIGLLIALSIIHGMLNSQQIAIWFEINTFTTPYFDLGVFYEYNELALGTEKVMIIGLFFINICFGFFTPNGVDDRE